MVTTLIQDGLLLFKLSAKRKNHLKRKNYRCFVHLPCRSYTPPEGHLGMLGIYGPWFFCKLVKFELEDLVFNDK